jgi:hypothetical protein
MAGDVLSNVLDIALFILLALSLVALLVAILLPAAQRKKLLHRLGRKWIV